MDQSNAIRSEHEPRRVAHLSDLHFGRTDEAIVTPLVEDLKHFGPHVAVITGDLTQRAKPPQFEAARDFLQQLGCPTVVVPGNHDIAPLYQPMRRVVDPFALYRHYVSRELDAIHCDDDLFVAGLNTVAPLRWKEGIVRARQARWLLQHASACGERVRIVASHHLLVDPVTGSTTRLAWGARSLLDVITAAGVELVLSGHLHETFSGPSTARVGRLSSVLVVQASTAISTRLRGHANAYNQLTVDRSSIDVRVREWSTGGFRTARTSRFPRRHGPAPEGIRPQHAATTPRV